MALFMLGTDICSYIMKRSHPHLLEKVRSDLKRRGEMIGTNDLMIAAHARSLGATLVTNNMREFVRVSGLAVENWAAP